MLGSVNKGLVTGIPGYPKKNGESFRHPGWWRRIHIPGGMNRSKLLFALQPTREESNMSWEEVLISCRCLVPTHHWGCLEGKPFEAWIKMGSQRVFTFFHDMIVSSSLGSVGVLLKNPFHLGGSFLVASFPMIEDFVVIKTFGVWQFLLNNLMDWYLSGECVFCWRWKKVALSFVPKKNRGHQHLPRQNKTKGVL